MSDEITNDELRLQAAQALGWKWHEWPDGNGGTRKMLRLDENFGYGAWYVGDGLFISSLLPNWPEDIAAAWPLVDMVMGAETRVVVEILPGGVYTVFVWAGGTTIERQADTAPRAICLAFIAWKQAQL